EAPLRVLLVHDESARPSPTSLLVLTWFHPLMDARGGENLLTHLNHLDRHEGAMPWGDAPPTFVPDRAPRRLLERGRIAGASLKYLRTLAPVPPVSPGGPPVPPGRACFKHESFVAPPSTDPRATREICWRVAVDGKRRALLLQLRRPRGLARRARRVFRTQSRERLSRTGRSPAAGNRRILQSLWGAEQSGRVLDRGRRDRSRGGKDRRGHSRGNGMERGELKFGGVGGPRRMRIAIVGAGPAGSALAILLARGGADVALSDGGRRPALLGG